MMIWSVDLNTCTHRRVYRAESALPRGLLLAAAVMACAGNATAQIAVGMDDGGGELHAPDAAGGVRVLTPFGATFTGGVRVAMGDVNRDGVADVIAGSGPGMAAAVKVFDGVTFVQIADFEPYGPQFTGGVYVAAGDVNGDGVADIITGAGSGGAPRVRVFDGSTRLEIANFLAYDAAFVGGVRVAGGDFDGDQLADIITGAGAGGGPHVKVFSGADGREILAFMAFEANFSGGVHVAAGDWNGDGKVCITAAAGASTSGGPRVRVFDGLSTVPGTEFLAYEVNFQGGVRVATGDVNGDGMDDIITAPGAGAAPLLKQFLAPAAIAGENQLAFGPNYLGGVFVASKVALPILMRDGFE